MKNVASLLSALLLAWGTAGAAVIYDNGVTPNNGFVSDTDFPPTGEFVADDFSLAAGASVITDVHWTGLYAFNNTPTEPDNFTIQIFSDAGGAPALSPDLSIAVGNPGRTDTGTNSSAGFDIYAYSVNVAPIPLLPGTTYWLSIFNNTAADTNDNWFWGMQDLGGNGVARTSGSDPWTPFTFRTDFQLTGVPEPSALVLFATGLVGLFTWRRKRAG